MKNKSIIGLFAALLGLSVTTTSCEDMLTPDMDLYAKDFSGKDTVNFYFGILSNLQDVVENNLILGELRGDLTDTTSYVSDTVASLANFDRVADNDNGLLNRSAYYKVINQCNFYLAKADTTAMKNNVYYMRREFAQVQMIRAWTYLQLVQNYGRVPFITKPVDNANTGWEVNPEEGFATPDNLLDLLLKNGLEQAYLYEKNPQGGRPNYGTLKNGAGDYAHSLTVFPADVVMGDLYLARGASKADYEKAASYYYDYMEEELREHGRNVIYRASISRMTSNGGNYSYWASAGLWASDMTSTPPSSNGEVVTMVLSAANKTFGSVLTRTAQIYGFDASSSSHTGLGGGEDGSEVVSSGQINLTANYRNRQVAASRRYQNLSDAQFFRDYEFINQEPVLINYWPSGDARIAGAVSKVRTTIGDIPFIQKRCISNTMSSNIVSEGSFSYNYAIPVYRIRQIYLRYAEAINRAGFPRHAFALLRDGLCENKLPKLHNDSIVDGKVFSYVVPEPNGSNIDVNEMRRAADKTYLDFSETMWNINYGIHELGCGRSYDKDTLYCYTETVADRMLFEAARTSSAEAETIRMYAERLRNEGKNNNNAGNTGDNDEEGEEPTEPVEPAEPVEPEPEDPPVIPEDIAYQINAVETLIADEMALETAFEGFRYYDLMRQARHKNNDVWGGLTADYGTNWLAWIISRRSLDIKPYDMTTAKQVDNTLYNKLLNTSNWYLVNPEY